MTHKLIIFERKESIDDIITLYNNSVYRKNGDTWSNGNDTYNLKGYVQLAIPFPEYNKIYKVKPYGL